MDRPQGPNPADASGEAKPAEPANEVKPDAISKPEKQRLKAERAKAKAAKQAARANGAKADKPKGEKAKVDKAKGDKAKADKAKGEKAKAKKPPLSKRLHRARMTAKKRARGKLKGARRRWKLTRRGTRRVWNRRYRSTYRKKITRVPARDELPALLNARGLVGKGVEIGVKLGHYSDELLSNWKGEELISIDPWLEAAPDEYVDRSNVAQERQDDNYEKTKERLAVYGSRSTIWRLTSVEAAPKVPDHSLDFVYVDARHDYLSVLEDLEAWCSKVKPGGILAGHDYVNGDLPQGEFYVKKAVDEFFGNRDIPVHSTEGPSIVEMFPTWIVEVPEDGVAPTAELTATTGRGAAASSADPAESAAAGDAAAEAAGERSRA